VIYQGLSQVKLIIKSVFSTKYQLLQGFRWYSILKCNRKAGF